VLLVLAPAYGFHRDELYFVVAGRHPALGYDDQPPLTPLVSAAAVALFGLEPVALRLLPAVSVALVAVLAGATARELGGRRRAQVLAAVVVAVSGYLAAGHLGVTATYDLLAWATVLWLAARILAGGDPRLWLIAGAVAGVGLWNKHLVLFLGFGLAVGLLVHRRDQLRTPWPWAGAALAIALWLPNLAWQVANGLPQLEMARSIGAGEGDDRAMLLVELVLLVGPLLFPVTIAGLWRLLRAEALRPFRALGTAFLAILAAVLLAGGKSYYVVGAVPPLMAAGAIALDGWLDGARWRTWVLAGATAGSAAIVALLTLPVLPAEILARTPIPDIYQENAETVGWPDLVATVAGAVADLPPDERERAVVLTANYGEAGALELLGHDLPPVYSGHNAAWRWGPPPDGLDVGLLVGWGDAAARASLFASCTQVAVIDNTAGMPNQERGQPVHVCTGLIRPWSAAWDAVRHLN
jgi:4-amino-4-deoxy-L-arabinose transferase-like glycosyltransferase